MRRYPLLLCCVLAVSCGSSGTDVSARAGSVTLSPGKTSPTPPQAPRVSITLGSPDFNSIATGSDMAIRGRVESIGPPRWNQKSGMPWSLGVGDRTSSVYPLQYRDATIAVVDRWFVGPKGERDTPKLTVRLRGDGNASAVSETFDVPGRAYGGGVIDGDVRPGDEVVMFVARTVFPMLDEQTEVFVPFANFFGVWTVEPDGIVRNLWPSRSLPATGLRDRAVEERRLGKRQLSPDDIRLSFENPLYRAP